jgi:hypothetical protein
LFRALLTYCYILGNFYWRSSSVLAVTCFNVYVWAIRRLRLYVFDCFYIEGEQSEKNLDILKTLVVINRDLCRVLRLFSHRPSSILYGPSFRAGGQNDPLNYFYLDDARKGDTAIVNTRNTHCCISDVVS